jgi:hypothetical protein
MMRKSRSIGLAAVALSLFACASGSVVAASGLGNYSLIRVRETAVGNRSFAVTPPREWNRQRGQLFVDIHEVEDWTLNGPLLDGISFGPG